VVGAALGMLFVTMRSFEELTEGFVLGSFPFYALVVGGVMVLRKREPDLSRPFRVPLYPLVPIVFLLGAAAVIVGGVLASDWPLLAALSLVVAGIPLRLLWLRSVRQNETRT
jgi:basic amino acid/polyamine antiporter, APA family